ncbi:MAG TPA: hypothetical protein VF579_14680 [Candidatus Methylomirabilis sp.]
MDNLPLIRRAFASLPATVTTFGFRADSACYDERVLKWLADPARPGGPRGPIGFPRGADMTEALHTVCAAVRERAWDMFEDRPDETGACTEVEVPPGDWPKMAAPLRDVALRIRKKRGRLFATGADTKYLAVVSNRWDLPVAALVRWHWQKAGTIEPVHDITKNEPGPRLSGNQSYPPTPLPQPFRGVRCHAPRVWEPSAPSAPARGDGPRPSRPEKATTARSLPPD